MSRPRHKRRAQARRHRWLGAALLSIGVGVLACGDAAQEDPLDAGLGADDSGAAELDAEVSGDTASPQDIGEEDGGRQTLRPGHFQDAILPPGPLDDQRAFEMPAQAEAPLHTFEGTLELLGEHDARSSVLRDPYNLSADFGRLRLPEMTLSFVQDGHLLLPVVEGLQEVGSPTWSVISGPGRVWSEPTDAGRSRASLTFALVQKNNNCTHNGTMSFLFDDAGVSKVFAQITQETCLYFQINHWGFYDAAYTSGPIDSAAQIRTRGDEERATAFPTASIEALAEDFPQFRVAALSESLTSSHTSAYGLVVDGVQYLGGCQTRSGQNPYCQQARLPSFSLAKSLFAGVARMRLEMLYGEEIAAATIASLVPEATQSGEWADVTLSHALNMVTGHHGSVEFFADEDSEKMAAFFAAESVEEKLLAALDWQRQTEPGGVWVYRTSDTFIATSAMEAFLASQEGPDADLFDFLVEEVFKPAGLAAGAHSSLRTSDDGWQGRAFGGYGLFFIPDDIAKLARLLNVDAGQVDQAQLLHPGTLAESLQQDPSSRGVDVLGAALPYKYSNGFWALEFTPSMGYGCSFWVPFMSGFGGITVAMLPGGITYWYFGDNNEFRWIDVVREVHDTVSDLCAL